MLKCRTYEEQRTMQGMGDESPSVGKCSANEGKTNRFAPFQIRVAFAAIGPRTPLASGMAAREGEDPHAGLQRSRQPGPTGGTPNCSLDEPANTDNGGMCNNCERHILWAELTQAPEIGQ
jgi:hypothetical protein